MNIVVFSLVLVCVFLNTAAQLVFKVGIDRIGQLAFKWDNFWALVNQLMFSPWIIGGIGIYVLSVLLWFVVLSKAPVSVAYPLSSLAYIAVAIAAYYFLGESLTVARVCGIVIILFGVYLVAK